MSANRLPHLILTAALIVSSALVAKAQAPGSSRNGGLPTGEGNIMLQGRIYFPSGQSASGKTIRVNLESVSAFGGGNTTVPDQDGVFRFNGLVPGDYTVVVDAGPEFEKAREPVGIYSGTSGKVVQVTIQLQPKISSSNPLFAGVPSNALNLYQKGMAAAKKNDSKAAVESLSAAVAAHPTFAIALNDLATQYMHLKQWDKAGETYDALIKLKPNDPVAHLNFGIVAFNQKKMEDAESHLRKAIELKSAGPSAHYYLGLIMISTKRYADAVPEFEAAIANGGENLALAHKYLGGLWMNAKPQEAADELEKYLKLDPKAPDADKIKGTIKDLRSKKQ
ncbi:MAG TPA: tetratricopeptide repeat protein [Pyrinomonadaceae bacterium]|nr:tetratricopeptide repeat protein [Pyrinomonadaceae bacterium]